MAAKTKMAVEEIVDDAAEVYATAAGGINRGVLLIGGLLVGGLVGYYIANKRLRKEYQEQAEEVIEQMREHYKMKTQALAATRAEDDDTQPEVEIPENIVERYRSPDQETPYHDIRKEPDPEVVAEEEAEPEIEVKRVLPTLDDIDVTWDWDAEKASREAKREEGVPYILHRTEYFGQESGFEQHTYIYFDGDDTLVDSSEHPVDDQDGFIGLENLGKFGHGSGDPAIVFIRNEELEMEIEVVHSPNKFTESRQVNPEAPSEGDVRKRRSRGKS